MAARSTAPMRTAGIDWCEEGRETANGGHKDAQRSRKPLHSIAFHSPTHLETAARSARCLAESRSRTSVRWPGRTRAALRRAKAVQCSAGRCQDRKMQASAAVCDGARAKTPPKRPESIANPSWHYRATLRAIGRRVAYFPEFLRDF